MRTFATAALAGPLYLLVAACAIMPDLPPDWAMPQQEILHHSACEIQTALVFLHAYPPPKSVFVATDWTVRISLNPKIDADIAPSAGLWVAANFSGREQKETTPKSQYSMG